MNDVMHEVRPLASFLMGNLRLFLRSGAHVVRIDEEAAHKLKEAFDKGEPADAVFRGSFLQLELGHLDALEWIADSRQPGTETPVDRALRRRGGLLFRSGWLQTMYELAPHNAAYSVAGLVAWKSAALLLISEYPELDDDERRDILRLLCLLWDDVPDPGANTVRQHIEALRTHQERTTGPDPTGDPEPEPEQAAAGRDDHSPESTDGKQHDGEEQAPDSEDDSDAVADPKDRAEDGPTAGGGL